MAKSKKTKLKGKSPSIKLKVQKYLDQGNFKMTDLARAMGEKYYTNLYPLVEPGANPTLLTLEQVAKGLSKLTKSHISIVHLLDLD